MQIIPIITIDASWVTASNIAEANTAEWSAATAYSIDDVVKVSSNDLYRNYRALVASTGVNPSTDDGTTWLDIGYENKWRFLDLYVTDKVETAGASITYTFDCQEVVSAISFFGLFANSVTVTVKDASDTQTFTQTKNLSDSDWVYDWISWMNQGDTYRRRREVVFDKFTAPTGYKIEVTISGGTGGTKVGQICLGKPVSVGKTMDGTRISNQKFGTVTRDSVGRIIDWDKRVNAKEVRYEVAMDTTAVNRAYVLLEETSNAPVVFYVEEDLDLYGVTLLGYHERHRITARTGQSFAQIDTIGLI